MRSHAKASSAGSNSSRGAGHRSLRRSGALATLSFALLAACLLPGTAAAKSHSFLETFGSAAQPSFGHAAGMAVDQSNGDLLVIDLEDKTLHRFKPNGEADPFSALGTNVIDGHAGGEDGTPQEEILSTEVAGSAVEAQVAIAPPGAAGGTAGNIYVTDAFNEKVDIFESTGKYIGQISVGYSCGVAVDPSGTVFVGDYYAGVHKLVPSAPGSFDESGASPFAASTPCQVAAAEGFIYANQYEGQVVKIDSEGAGEGGEKYVVSPGANTTVTVDPASGNVLTATESEVKEFDVSGGSSASEVSATTLASAALGIAVDQTSGNIYASRAGNAEVETYAPFPTKFHIPLGAFGSAAQPTTTNFTEGLAVDQSTGDLLFVDSKAGTLSRYNPDGTPADFSALGTNVIDAKGGADATPQNGFALSFFSFEVQVAVDNSGTATDGDIYVTADEHHVDVFSSTGAYLGQLSASSEGAFGKSCGVAVDSNGAVYVGDYAGKIHKYVPAANPPVTADNTANFSFSEACALAAGNGPTAGYLFATHRFGAVEKLDSATGAVEYPVSGGTNFLLSVDPGSGRIYAANLSEVKEFDASGTSASLETSFSTFPVGSGSINGIAVNGDSGDVYVADNQHSTISVWSGPRNAPIIATGEATALSGTGATLNGTVNPNSKQLSDCHFEWGAEAGEYNLGSAPCVPAAPSIPADRLTRPVSATIGGLTPNTTYHFRLAATSSEGAVVGTDRSFATRGPAVGTQLVEDVSFADATLSAKINPRGEATTYHLEYGTSSSYGQSTPESAPIGFEGDEAAHTVSVQIGGLTPNTTYHFRFVATNAAASAEGPDATFTTYSQSSAYGPCPNDSLRSGIGARLPDCRAYEQVTPVDKHGASAQGALNSIQASSAGNRITFYLTGGLPTSGGSASLSPFLASRDPGGWSTDGFIPLAETGDSASFNSVSEADLSKALVFGPGPGNVGEGLYLRDSASGAFQLGVASPERFGAVSLAGFASDTSHLIFETNSTLLPSAPAEVNNLYDLDHGTLTLAGRIPAGAATSCDDETGPACVAAPEGSFAGPYNWQGSSTAFGGAGANYYTQNTISRDGSKVFFTSRNAGQLYVREGGIRTTRISASQRTTPDPNGEKPAAFLAATPDGSKVFFASCEKLTDDSTAVSTVANTCTSANQGQDIYSYDTGSGELTDLTVDSNAGDLRGAAVKGVLGTSTDGSYVYFVASGDLAPGASSGSCATNGACNNLYVSHNGAITFVVGLAAGDFHDWTATKSAAVEEPKTSRISADGQTVLFSSLSSLTGYDNIEAASGCGGPFNATDPCEELFRYTAEDEELDCVSCNPTGARPSYDAVLGTYHSFFRSEPRANFLTRNLSADGNRVFFDSRDALLPSDTNGVTDVYEWEAKGSGSCKTESQNGGCLYLISGGTSPDEAYFADASADGDHVFLFSNQRLVPSDRDQLYDVYDAGVGAGLSSQHPLAAPTCTSTACQANPAPPPEQTPASAAFAGAGNVHKPTAARRCPKGKRKVRRAGKVSCKKAHTQHKRHTNRGGSK